MTKAVLARSLAPFSLFRSDPKGGSKSRRERDGELAYQKRLKTMSRYIQRDLSLASRVLVADIVKVRKLINLHM